MLNQMCRAGGQWFYTPAGLGLFQFFRTSHGAGSLNACPCCSKLIRRVAQLVRRLPPMLEVRVRVPVADFFFLNPPAVEASFGRLRLFRTALGMMQHTDKTAPSPRLSGVMMQHTDKSAPSPEANGEQRVNDSVR